MENRSPTALPWYLGATAALMVSVFFLLIGKIEINRVQEDVYLGIPYRMLLSGDVRIMSADPFEENGPHAVFPPAAILKVTGSLLGMRFYLFLFSVAVMILIFGTSIRDVIHRSSRSTPSLWLSVATGLAVWMSIPHIISYPSQTNGMMFGLVFVLLALLSLDRSPAISFLLLGCAASSKGQFLAFFPGLLAYDAVIKRSGTPLFQRLCLVSRDGLLFFVPHVALSALFLIFGWFSSMGEFWTYTSLQWRIITSQLAGVFAAVVGGSAGAGSHNGFSSRFAEGEFKTYGPLAWGHMLFSFFMCLWSSAHALRQRIMRRPISYLDGPIGFMGAPYWINFLFFWGYPYWYNVLAILPFNIYFAIRLLDAVERRLKTRVANRPLKIIHLSAACLLFIVFMNRLIFYHPFDVDQKGNATTPYPWMGTGLP